MKNKWKTLRWLMALTLALAIYPLCVIGYTWTCVFRSDLKGGGNGHLDAYRHTLASSVVSYTIGDWAVNATTFLMESSSKDSSKMDAHNNHIGAQIGAHAQSFSELEPTVRDRVLIGDINATDPNQITWLPKKKWSNRRIW
jgi:hypothetical protein